MKFTYMKTPLYRYTFQNRRIREWVEQNCEGRVLNLFAGKTKLNIPHCDWEVRNDIREDMPADYHMDALEFVKGFPDAFQNPKIRGQGFTPFNTIILDPPYAYRKSMEMYEGAVSSSFNKLKDELPKIMTLNGIVITFGYHSNVMGEKRGFKQEHILLMSHGGAIHDTIAVIERRQTIESFFERK